MIQVDLTHMRRFIALPYEAALAPRLRIAHNHLQKGDGAGGDFTGWGRLPQEYDRQEFDRIQAAARRIQSDSRALVVIGIGGSYLGARAMLELLTSPNYNLLRKKTPQIFFTGNTLSSDALTELLDYVRDKDFSVNVISKSGDTTESSIAFFLFRQLLEEKYGREGARDRIFATTDRREGTLRALANQAGYATFSVPASIGGRYSVLTAAGLLPLAVAGLDIQEMLAGSADAMGVLRQPGQDNPAWQYAAARHALHESGKKVEMLAGYEPSFRFFAEWWKQLYGESEGKEGKGLFPASLEYTADLHSMGQYIQEGQRLMCETVVDFAPKGEFLIPNDPENIDGLNFLAGKPLSFVAEKAMRGVMLAHVDGGVPNVLIQMPAISETSVGFLIYFFEYVCGLSGHLLEINPFNQPGVEAYKSNMFALLGKPGYEARQAELEARL